MTYPMPVPYPTLTTYLMLTAYPTPTTYGMPMPWQPTLHQHPILHQCPTLLWQPTLHQQPTQLWVPCPSHAPREQVSAPVDQGRSYQVYSDILSCICIQPLVDFLRGSKGCSFGFLKHYQPSLGYQSLFLFLSLFRPSFNQDCSWVSTPLSFQLTIQLSSTAPTFNTHIVCYKGGHCGNCQYPSWLSPFSSFSLYHASLIFLWSVGSLHVHTLLWPLFPVRSPRGTDFLLSLKESWDSLSIGFKRTLRHELISELSNVMDDLQII